MTIRIEKLRKAFLESGKEQAVLKGIDYSFVPGRLYVIKGRSGCGKSTLLNLIGLLDKPTSGSVFIDGNDTGAMTEKEREDFRRRNISFLSQDENVIPEWSVLDNLRLVCQNNERIEKSLSGLGILDKKAQKVESLSMGERMRGRQKYPSFGRADRKSRREERQDCPWDFGGTRKKKNRHRRCP